MVDSRLVEVGFCVKAHGIKGGLILHLENPTDSLLAKGTIVHVFPKNEKSMISSAGSSFEIEKISFGNKVIAYFGGVINRNQVEELLPFRLYLPREIFPKIKSDEFYLVDLIGFSVVDKLTHGVVGIIQKYYDHGAQINIVVSTEEGEIDIPLIDEFILQIDLENQKVIVKKPEYLD